MSRVRRLSWSAALLFLVGCQSGPRPEFEPIGTDVANGGLPRLVVHNPTGMVLRLVVPGSFVMGSPADEADRDSDERQHEVSVDRAFYLGETEVTIRQWRTTMDVDPSDGQGDPELPVGGATWYASKEFIRRLNAGQGGFRLPTEAEWEYACRAGSTSAFPFGEQITTDQVNYDGRYPYVEGEFGERRRRAIPVRSLPPNAWGFYQMPGNVWEWCEDVYFFDPRRADRVKAGPGAPRVLRGGAFTSGGEQVRSAHREGYPPNSDGSNYGLRLAWTPPADWPAGR